MQCNAVQCNTIQYNTTIQCNAIQCNARSDTELFDSQSVLMSKSTCNTIQYNAIQYNAMQCSTIQYNIINLYDLFWEICLQWDKSTVHTHLHTGLHIHTCILTLNNYNNNITCIVISIDCVHLYLCQGLSNLTKALYMCWQSRWQQQHSTACTETHYITHSCQPSRISRESPGFWNLSQNPGS